MSNQIHNIHDAYFKQVLSDPMLAGTFLREHLPADVVDLLGPEPPERIPGSFVDEELRQHHSDLLFRVQLKKTDRDAFAYVLMEHKSSPDKGARLQLLRYVVRLLTQWYEQHKHPLPLPPVLPLLVHQGPEDWTASCEFSDLFGIVLPPLQPYLPSFRHALIDLATIDDRTLSAQVRLRAFLKALKYSRCPHLPDCLDIVLAEIPVLDDKDLFVILNYFSNGPIAINNDVLHDTLQRLVPERKEKIVGWFSQPYYDKGRAEGHDEGYAEGHAQGHAEGHAQGEAKGEAQGRAKMLSHFLEWRFGAIPDSLLQRIFTADVGTIESWGKRSLDAPDLQSVFETN